MVRYLVYTVVQQLKYFQVKGSISNHYNPYMILLKIIAIKKQHFEIPIGAYVLVKHNTSPKHSNKACMVDIVYLMTNYNGIH